MIMYVTEQHSVVLYDRHNNKITNIGTIADITRLSVSKLRDLEPGTYISQNGIIFKRKEKKE